MMKCEHCGKHEATFYYKSNINGRVTEKHLCPACANAQGYTETFRPVRLFDEVFRPFGMLRSFDRMLTEFPAPEEMTETRRSEELLDREERQTLTKQRQANALRSQLKDAVEREDFETAIRLRDELRQMGQ